jgi:hypothetical protein
MAENDPIARLADSAARKKWLVWLLKIFWPIPGAILGATVGFHLYFRQPGLNTDTLAPLISASLWAFGGMLSGILSTSITAWFIQRGIHRWFSMSPLNSTALTLLCLIALCLGLYAPLEIRLPAVLWPVQPAQKKSLRVLPTPSPCSEAPPSDLNARKSWELECR